MRAYEPSRQITSFFIAGFQHWDGASVLSELAVGEGLLLEAEPANPYDPEAVAILRGEVKLGYVPRDENALISLLTIYGHTDALECRVLQVAPEADPWKQVRVGLFVTDARDKG